MAFQVYQTEFVPDIGEATIIVANVHVEELQRVSLEWHLLVRIHREVLSLYDGHSHTVSTKPNTSDIRNPVEVPDQAFQEHLASAKSRFRDYQIQMLQSKNRDVNVPEATFARIADDQLVALVHAIVDRREFEVIKAGTASRELQGLLRNSLATVPL